MAMAAQEPGGQPSEPYGLRSRRFDPEWLARAMVVRDLSLEDLARLSGLGYKTVRLACKGDRMWPETMSAILRVLAENPPTMELPER